MKNKLQMHISVFFFNVACITDMMYLYICVSRQIN